MLTDPIDGRRAWTRRRDLKVVANIAVGYDNIDVAAAQARGIVVTNTPDVLTEATAEFTWALILAVTRRLSPKASGWSGAAAGRAGRSTSCSAWSSRGKQLGIIGRGRIGRAVAAKAPAFGMKAVFAARDGRSSPDLPELSLDELLVSSDVISIHAPLTPETRHLIDRARARADEAVGVSRQHRARAGRRRRSARLGARAST